MKLPRRWQALVDRHSPKNTIAIRQASIKQGNARRMSAIHERLDWGLIRVHVVYLPHLIEIGGTDLWNLDLFKYQRAVGATKTKVILQRNFNFHVSRCISAEV